MSERRTRKGSFSQAELPVASSYVYPKGRNRLLLLGGAIGTFAIAALLADFFLVDGRVAISSGSLSSAHAGVEDECATCHTGFASVTNEKCSVCHEKYGDDLGVYTFDAHYIYRSRDATRAFRRDRETACFSCHPEHGGRDAAITAASDTKCTICHEFRSFNDGHPQFEFLATALQDDAGISFPHIRHVQEVRNRQKIDDVETACLYCHNPRDDGRGFEPISFESLCSACHLGANVRSANLPTRDPDQAIVQDRDDGVTVQPGVETLEAIRARAGPGEQWALNTNPNDFRVSGRRVMKTRTEHEDLWITHNLEQLRRAIYPSLGLAELLKASPEVAEDEVTLLYEEAIETLRERAAELRGQPEPWVQEELEEIDRLLNEVERRVGDKNTPLDDSRFLLAERRDPRLSMEQVQELTEFAERLTAPCQACHQITNATFRRVQKDQRTLGRAEFNHRAHIIQRRCLDCHTRIPFLSYLDNVAEVSAEVDNAAIQNLPGIEACQACHTPNLASNSCSTCHYFHPNKEHQSRLQFYLQ